MNLDILVVGYLAQESLSEALSSIVRWSAPGYRLTIHDNSEKNYPLSWLWNRFIEQSQREFVALVNPDVLVGPGWDTETVACLEVNPNCAVAAPYTNHDPIRESYPAIVPDKLALDEIGSITAEVRAAFKDRRFILSQDKRLTPAHCCVIRKSAWAKVHGFDEKIPFTGNDYDFNYRTIQAGYKVGLCTHAMSFHKWHKSVDAAIQAGTYDTARQRPRFAVPPPGATWGSI